MGAKAGILHDYDLLANAEPAAQQEKRCVGCDNRLAYQWSDYSGEAMCVRCGCPYRLKWGGEQRERDGAYPYLNLRDELVEPLRAYYAETQRFTYLGFGLGHRPGLEEFCRWLRANRAEVWAVLTAPAQEGG